MYDELVKRLRHSANFAERGLTPPPSELREAADAIEKTPRWISVEERLPEERDNYLVLTEELENYVCDFIPSVKQWWTVPGDTFLIDVTHWMPLPEPPKEGE